MLQYFCSYKPYINRRGASRSRYFSLSTKISYRLFWLEKYLQFSAHTLITVFCLTKYIQFQQDNQDILQAKIIRKVLQYSWVAFQSTQKPHCKYFRATKQEQESFGILNIHLVLFKSTDSLKCSTTINKYLVIIFEISDFEP